MSIYYQHIGEAMWKRDAPESIGTPSQGPLHFRWSAIEPYLDGIDEAEQEAALSKQRRLAPNGFQIWGIPSGAERILAKMGVGDWLMLLEHSDFRYVGRVIHRFSKPLWALSRKIWGEQKFPLIILLDGHMICYPWKKFHDFFDFDPKYHMRGNTHRLADLRIERSPAQNERRFIEMLKADFSDIRDIRS